MLRSALICLAVAALPLAGCDSSKQGTSISLNASSGNVTASADGTSGQVSLNIPGFSGKMTLPKIHLDGEEFDMNGVHLYPGSSITTMNIDAKHDNDGVVHVGFDSPADPQVVRDWLQQRLTKAGFTLHADGSGLAGTTDEKRPFALQLTPDGAGRAKGEITISG